MDVTRERGSDSAVILHKKQPAPRLRGSKSMASRVLLRADIWSQTARQVHNDYADNTLAKGLQVQGAA